MYHWALAADQHGIVSMLELRRAGLTSAEIEALVRNGQLTRLARGWYALQPPVSAENRHVLTTRAMLRAHERRAVAGHHSALLLLGLPTYGADLATVRLNRREVGSPRTRAGQRLGRAVPLEGQLELTVVPALAVVQHGISAGSLSALVAADAFVRTGGSVEDLGVALDWVRYHPHTTQLRSALDRVDGRHESPGETLLGHALHVMGVASTPQLAITDGSFRAVVDFLVDKRVVIEFDGRVKYGRPSDTPDPFGRKQSPEQVLWQEKAREDHLRELGYEVLRVTWADLQNPIALAARIRNAIERARRRNGLLTA
jgi:very-short-patch-repair endonuclease